MLPRPKMPITTVWWKDHTGQDAWIDGDEMDEYTQLHEIVSIGWLKEETDEKIVLVSAVDPTRHGYSAIQTIGKAMVTSIKYGRKKRKFLNGYHEKQQPEKPSSPKANKDSVAS